MLCQKVQARDGITDVLVRHDDSYPYRKIRADSCHMLLVGDDDTRY